MFGRNKLLLVDIGNTRVKYAYSTEGELTQQCYAASLAELDLSGVIEVRIGSVARKAEVEQWLATLPDDILIKQAKVSPEAYGVRCIYPDCSRLGVDRWLAMIAARKENTDDLVVIDLGSAITVDYLAKNGQHDGGYIVPGLAMMRKSLGQTTEQVGLSGGKGKKITPGSDTSSCVDHGVMRLAVNFVQSVIDENAEKAQVFITGGDSKQVCAKISGAFEIDESLVIRGLQHCFD